MVSKQVMLKKKGKRKSKKTTTTRKPTPSIKNVTNIHINSKSGTRSKRQQRGGVGGYVAPSGASTISHVPLVMNVPAPDATQRETKWMHTLEDIQSDNIALRMQLDEFIKNQGTGTAPDPNDKNAFQKQASKANFEDDLTDAPPLAPARPRRGRVAAGTPVAEPIDEPITTRSISVPAESRGLTTPPQDKVRSSQGVGLEAESAEETPLKRGRKPKAKKQAEKAAEEVKAGKQKTMEEFKK